MLSAPAPDNTAERDELSSLSSSLEGDYGKGKYCREVSGKSECLDINGASNVLSSSRDPKELADVWAGWHRVGAPMRDRYTRFAELSNKGARELGFADTGALWRSNYDMPPDEFAAEVDRLWTQVQPLYMSLHTYVRSKLAREVRRRRDAGQRHAARASARQHVGAGLEQHLSAGRRAAVRRRRTT